MKITGRLIKIMQPETFNTFTKQTIWVEEITGQYPNTYSIDMSGQSLDYMGNYKTNDLVDVEVNVRGRYYNKNGKEGVFNSLAGWKIQKVGVSQSAPADNGGHPAGFKPVETAPDDLPF